MFQKSKERIENTGKLVQQFAHTVVGLLGAILLLLAMTFVAVIGGHDAN